MPVNSFVVLVKGTCRLEWVVYGLSVMKRDGSGTHKTACRDSSFIYDDQDRSYRDSTTNGPCTKKKKKIRIAILSER